MVTEQMPPLWVNPDSAGQRLHKRDCTYVDTYALKDKKDEENWRSFNSAQEALAAYPSAEYAKRCCTWG